MSALQKELEALRISKEDDSALFLSRSKGQEAKFLGEIMAKTSEHNDQRRSLERYVEHIRKKYDELVEQVESEHDAQLAQLKVNAQEERRAAEETRNAMLGEIMVLKKNYVTEVAQKEVRDRECRSLERDVARFRALAAEATTARDSALAMLEEERAKLLKKGILNSNFRANL